MAWLGGHHRARRSCRGCRLERALIPVQILWRPQTGWGVQTQPLPRGSQTGLPTAEQEGGESPSGRFVVEQNQGIAGT